jgi:hypothetical protein
MEHYAELGIMFHCYPTPYLGDDFERLVEPFLVARFFCLDLAVGNALPSFL